MSFIDSVKSWNNVSARGIIFLIIIVTIGTICIFYTNFDSYDVVSINNVCIAKCDHNMCRKLTQLRDSGYSLNTSDQPYNCIFTMWELSHVFFHMFLGYYFNIYIAITISVVYEIYEHFVHHCGSVLDLFWNTFGALIGVALRHYITKIR